MRAAHLIRVCSIGFAAAGICLGAAQAQTSTVIIAPSAPPAPRVETIPPPPSMQTQVMTWEAGHWVWNGTGWNWQDGHYVQRPSTAAVWEPGHWQQSNGGWVWVEGQWRS